jgi:hypothetical protein
MYIIFTFQMHQNKESYRKCRIEYTHVLNYIRPLFKVKFSSVNLFLRKLRSFFKINQIRPTKEKIISMKGLLRSRHIRYRT